MAGKSVKMDKPQVLGGIQTRGGTSAAPAHHKALVHFFTDEAALWWAGAALVAPYRTDPGTLTPDP